MSGLRSILIADHDDASGKSTARLLEREGYGCRCVSDASECLALLHQEHFDLLITDVALPGSPDLRLVRETRRIDGGLPVIVVTGRPSLESAIEAVQLPVTAYLTKPVAWSELRAKVRSSLACSRSHQSLSVAKRQLRLCLGNIRSLEESMVFPSKVVSLPDLSELLSGTVEQLAQCLTQLHGLHTTVAAGDQRRELDEFLPLKQKRILQDAIKDAIRVVKATKGFCKTKELGDLRVRLERVLESGPPRQPADDAHLPRTNRQFQEPKGRLPAAPLPFCEWGGL